MPGPIPKRSDERRRRNVPDGGITAATSRPTTAPPPSEDWHPMARDWYLSLGQSGQAVFYQASDWQVARVWAEILSRQLQTDKVSAVMIQAWASSAAELLTTEGSRRRGRLELERSGQVDEDEDASVTALDAYRAQLGS
jgi:hypothetical protein